MIKTILLAVLIFFAWNSTEARNITASALRYAADWLEIKDEPKGSQKTYQIPNPFYTD